MMVYFLPVISAAIGWFTNYVAIKMLFHPRKEMDLIIFKLQGIFPKRKPTLAKRLGKIVAKDLFTPDMISTKLQSNDSHDQIKSAVMEKLDEYLEEKLKGAEAMLSLFGGDQVVVQIRGKVEGMVDDMVPQMTLKISEKIENVDIEQMVTDKVMAFSDEKFEDLLMSVIKKELTFIEVMGAILGFLIGLLQVGLVLMS
ncbi:DUF445 family protein [Limibacter armeniacum]|uniref:DUF445 domain-containing protein n=1 Tax=Limibacter armeniacum TaxID=466084 RepID=UPI002FE5D948